MPRAVRYHKQGGPEVMQELAQLVLLDGELLAHCHRGVPVAQPRDEQRHQDTCRPGWNRPAPRVTTSTTNLISVLCDALTLGKLRPTTTNELWPFSWDAPC